MNPTPTPVWSPNPQPMTPVQARVLGTLMEKARTVPDSYPLSLNSLLLGCNQKTSRDPVMDLSEADVAAAVAELAELNLVRTASGGRVARYEHNAQRGLGVPEQSAVLLGLLMLRGPQTAAELRLNADRWYRFADVSSVEGFLEELQTRSEEKGGPLVKLLPRGAGMREPRWCHLLCGGQEVDATTHTHVLLSPSSAADRLSRLEAEVTQLRAVVRKLCDELGLASDAMGI